MSERADAGRFVRLTFDGPLKEHLAAAAGHDPVVASRGLVRTNQTDFMRLPAGLGLARHGRTAGLSCFGRRADMRPEKEKGRKEKNIHEDECTACKYKDVGDKFKAGCRGLVHGYRQPQWYVVLLLGDMQTLRTNPTG